MAEATLNQQSLASSEPKAMRKQTNPIDAVAQSHVVRHLARLVGLAAAVAIGMVVVCRAQLCSTLCKYVRSGFSPDRRRVNGERN